MRIYNKRIFTTKIRHIFWKLSVNFAKLVQRFTDKYLKSFDFLGAAVRRYSAKQVFLQNYEFCKFLSTAASGSHKFRYCLILSEFTQIELTLNFFIGASKILIRFSA